MECSSDDAAVLLHVSACFCVLMGPVRASLMLSDKKECKNSLNRQGHSSLLWAVLRRVSRCNTTTHLHLLFESFSVLIGSV
jgi:hypothetical protein